MSISDEIQNEINKARRIEDEINTNLKRRSDKIEKKMSTSTVNRNTYKKQFLTLCHYLKFLGRCKIKISSR
jgi:hypothetical protein